MDKKKICITVVVIIAILIGGYVLHHNQQSLIDKTMTDTPLDSRAMIRVVATFYPLQQLAAGIVGDMGEVSAVVPAGMEPHDYEPSIGDVKSIYTSNLFILNGAGMDTWAEKLMPELKSQGIPSIRLADTIILLKAKKGLGHEYNQGEETVAPIGMGSSVGDERGQSEWDPHFWLDPVSTKSLVAAITAVLSERFPEQRSEFEVNAEKTILKLDALDAEYRTGLGTCSKKEVVTSHDAFRYLADRYGFETHALAGISPEEEPAPKRLAELATKVKLEGIKYIFFETLVSPKIAETLARETGVETLVFNPIEGVTREESAAGIDYWSLMRTNLSALQKALECK